MGVDNKGGVFTETADSDLAIVVADILERRRLEQLVHQLDKVRPRELHERANTQLITRVIKALRDGPPEARLITKELDKATKPQRALVASMAEEGIAERLGAHRIMTLRRHGAKFVWALGRDRRPHMDALAIDFLGKYVAEVQRLQKAKQAVQEAGDASPMQAMYEEAADRAVELEAEASVSKREQERLASAAAEAMQAEEVLRLENQELRKRAHKASALEGRLQELTQRSSAPSTEAPDGDVKKRALQKAEHQVQKLSRELENLAGLRARFVLLEKENQGLREKIDQLRSLRKTERTTQNIRQEAPEHEPKKPVVQAPRRRKAQSSGQHVRVGVYIDAANIAGAARRLFERSVDYQRLLEVSVSNRRMVTARAYVINKSGLKQSDAQPDDFAKFQTALRAARYQVIAKVPKVFADGTVKADWDVGLCVDVMLDHQQLDVVVLGTGDGDFVPLVRALKRSGLRVEAIGFSERTAPELIQAVDCFTPLDQTILYG